MADEREPARLHPDDLSALVEALRSGPVRLPPPPSDVPSGIDARVISEAVRAIVGEKVSAFLTRDQIRDLFTEWSSSKKFTDAMLDLMDDRLGTIGLRMDKDHIAQTAEDLGGTLKWHRWASKTWMAALGTIVLGALYAALRKVGFPVPMPS